MRKKMKIKFSDAEKEEYDKMARFELSLRQLLGSEKNYSKYGFEFDFEKETFSYKVFIYMLKAFLNTSAYKFERNFDLRVMCIYGKFIYFLLDNGLSVRDILDILEEENIIILIKDYDLKDKFSPFGLLECSENFLIENLKAIDSLIDLLDAINESYTNNYINRKEFESHFISKLSEEVKLLYATLRM